MSRCGWRRGLAGLLGLALALLGFALPAPAQQPSSYQLSLAAPFNRLDHYPPAQNLAPPPDYRPVGEWIGRLILPSVEELARVTTLGPVITDWVWFEILHAPEREALAVGQRVRLEWTDAPELQAYVEAVSTDVQLSEQAAFGRRWGNVIPTRLDGRQRVGPLQSLAGARPEDDAIVQLDAVIFTGRDGETPVLQIGREPLLVAERYVGLVEIVAAAEPDTWENPAERFRVRHYNPDTGEFNGRQEVVRIPAQPRDRNDRYLSTPHRLDQSPAGKAGWYIYGASDRDGVFTVRALIPRQALRLDPERIALGRARGRRYIQQANWQDEPERKGTLQTVLLDPQTTEPNLARRNWRTGDRALLIHLFGGIGGDRGEPMPGGTVTGHFAYGNATLVRDAFTNEPQWQLEYWQIYAHNPNGIIAGRSAWSEYMGNLQRGWLGARPVSDVLVKFEPLTRDYDFGLTQFSPFDELMHQLQIMAARYRTGDGSGYAGVTPATSCVQDASQALYIAIARLQHQLDRDPTLQTWLQAHRDSPQVQRFRQLGQLRNDILELLEPRGQVRSDWQQNAEYLAGVSGRAGFATESSLQDALLSWRSMMPRRAHDEVARTLLDRGAALWLIRTNQVGGRDPTILPVAPTVALGQYPILPDLVSRLALALQPVTLRTVAIALAALAIYAAIALPLGFFLEFLTWEPAQLPVRQWATRLTVLFFMPALFEELIFRVWLLPAPGAAFIWWRWLLWAILGLGLFVAYHPLHARTTYRRGAPTFYQPPFLILAALLGLTCTLTYGLTGSLWAIAVQHWFITGAWLLFFGGNTRLALT